MKWFEAALLFALSCSPADGETPGVAVRMRHVMLHLGHGADLRVDDLRGWLESRTDQPPSFDDLESYRVRLDYGRIAMASESMANVMNQYVFAAPDAPLKKLTVSIDGQELVQSGVLKKGISVPFEMRASIAVTPDGRLRIHPTSIKAAGFVSKRVLDFFGLQLARIVSLKDTRGVAIEGDDLLLNPQDMLPPPRIAGRLTRASVEGGQIVLQFGDGAARGVEPPAGSAVNYMYYRGGTLRFGRLTMTDTDLLLIDDDPRDLFDFNPQRYFDQLVAGYSKTTRSGGLIVYMPDADDLVRGGPRTTS